MMRLAPEASAPRPSAIAALRHLAAAVLMRSRPAIVGLGVGIGLCVGIVAITVGSGLVDQLLRSRSSELEGGVILKDHAAPPDFRLSNQFGAIDTLGALRGRPVVLTFLYTNCADVCPLIAANLHQTYKSLGNQAQQIEIIAVTVDPERDTPDNIRRFLDQRGLTSEWRFLTGSYIELAAVWSAYHIGARPDAAAARPLSPAAQLEARGLPAPPDVVEHSAPIFLIDRHGVLRAMLPVDATPKTLTMDLRVLLGES